MLPLYANVSILYNFTINFYKLIIYLILYMGKAKKESMNEKMFCALASEKSLAKYWNSEEEEKAWKKLKSKK